MHLLTFMQMTQPSWATRAVVLVAQGILWNALFVSYVLSPSTVHRFVGYLEEEAGAYKRAGVNGVMRVVGAGW